MSRFHPASPEYRECAYGQIRYHAVTQILTAPIKALGSLLSPSTPSLPAPAAATTPPVVPTVDTATQAVQEQQQQDQVQAQKKGALSTLLQTGNTQTGQQLGAAAPEATLKRLLGS